MNIYHDLFGRRIRLTQERNDHIKDFHPEMKRQLAKIKQTLLVPNKVIRSKSDKDVQLFYKFYEKTPVKNKFLCVVVKAVKNDYFILTAYFTDAIKRGESLWTKINK